MGKVEKFMEKEMHQYVQKELTDGFATLKEKGLGQTWKGMGLSKDHFKFKDMKYLKYLDIAELSAMSAIFSYIKTDEMINLHYETLDALKEKGKTSKYDVSDFILTCINKTKFNNEIEKKMYCNLILTKTDFSSSEQQKQFRQFLIRMNKQSIEQYTYHLKLLYSFNYDNKTVKEMSLDTSSGKSWDKVVSDDCKYLENNEYITIYRGFNTRKLKDIRKSNNKKKSDYYIQNEGVGYSFSLDKFTTLAFSYRYQQRKKVETFENQFDFVSNQKLREKLIGRATIGRYVVKSEDVKFYCNTRNEREIMVNDRNVRLIDYKFVSDMLLQMSDIEHLTNVGSTSTMAKGVQKIKNHWINKNWKSDVKITKQIKDLF